MFRPPHRRLQRFVRNTVVFAALYLGTYAINSSCGGYWLETQTGGRLNLGGMTSKSAIYWMPRYGYYWKNEPVDVIAVLYAPLVWVDRAYNYPKHDLWDKDYYEWITTCPLDEIHPEFREPLKKNRERHAQRNAK